MDKQTRIGILLTAKEDNVQMGLVELDPGGMMIFSILKPGLHYFAMKPISRFFEEDYKGEALYKKYASQIDELGGIPEEQLWMEAKAIAEAMNTHGVNAGGKSVHAKACRYSSFHKE